MNKNIYLYIIFGILGFFFIIAIIIITIILLARKRKKTIPNTSSVKKVAKASQATLPGIPQTYNKPEEPIPTLQVKSINKMLESRGSQTLSQICNKPKEPIPTLLKGKSINKMSESTDSQTLHEEVNMHTSSRTITSTLDTTTIDEPTDTHPDHDVSTDVNKPPLTASQQSPPIIHTDTDGDQKTSISESSTDEITGDLQQSPPSTHTDSDGDKMLIASISESSIDGDLQQLPPSIHTNTDGNRKARIIVSVKEVTDHDKKASIVVSSEISGDFQQLLPFFRTSDKKASISSILPPFDEIVGDLQQSIHTDTDGNKIARINFKSSFDETTGDYSTLPNQSSFSSDTTTPSEPQ